MWPGLRLGLTDGIHVSKTKEAESRTDLNRWQVEWGREQPLALGSWVVSSVCRVGKMSIQLIVTVSWQCLWIGVCRAGRLLKTQGGRKWRQGLEPGGSLEFQPAGQAQASSGLWSLASG